MSVLYMIVYKDFFLQISIYFKIYLQEDLCYSMILSFNNVGIITLNLMTMHHNSHCLEKWLYIFKSNQRSVKKE